VATMKKQLPGAIICHLLLPTERNNNSNSSRIIRMIDIRLLFRLKTLNHLLSHNRDKVVGLFRLVGAVSGLVEIECEISIIIGFLYLNIILY